MTVRRYVAIETAISAAINAVLSIAFAWLVFGGRADVDLGARATWIDMAPQSFMVALMAVLVPVLLTKRRIVRGVFDGPRRVSARHPLVTALIAAVAATVGMLALYRLSVPGIAVPLAQFVAAKALFGAALGALVTPLALLSLLRR